jgi:Tfp pilus assembly protein PilF
LGLLHTRLTEYETALTFLGEALVTLQELDDSWGLGDVLTYYGWTLHENGQPHRAKKYFEVALKVQRDKQQEAKMMETVAHLGRAALATNDLSLATTCARRALDFITGKGAQGIEHPALVYLICYQIIQTNEKFVEAQSVLAQGYEYITTQAAQIDDLTLQQSYLNNIPENRLIQELMLTENAKTPGN